MEEEECKKSGEVRKDEIVNDVMHLLKGMKLIWGLKETHEIQEKEMSIGFHSDLCLMNIIPMIKQGILCKEANLKQDKLGCYWNNGRKN